MFSVHTYSRTQPQTPSLARLHMYKTGPHLLCRFGRGELCRCAVRSGEAGVMQHFGSPSPTHTFYWPQLWFIRHLFPPRKPQDWPGLKPCRVCRVSHFLCWHPHLVSTGLPTEHTYPIPFPKSDFAASNHYASAARFLESGRIGARDLGCTVFLPKGGMRKMVPKWSMARTPRFHLAFSLTALLFTTCLHVVHGWVWE